MTSAPEPTPAPGNPFQLIRLGEHPHLLPGVALDGRCWIRSLPKEGVAPTPWRPATEPELERLLFSRTQDLEPTTRMDIFSTPPRLCRRLRLLAAERQESGVTERPTLVGECSIGALVDFFRFIEAPIRGEHSVIVHRIPADPPGHRMPSGAHINLDAGDIRAMIGPIEIPVRDISELAVVLRPFEGIFLDVQVSGQGPRAIGQPGGSLLLSVSVSGAGSTRILPRPFPGREAPIFSAIPVGHDARLPFQLLQAAANEGIGKANLRLPR